MIILYRRRKTPLQQQQNQNNEEKKLLKKSLKSVVDISNMTMTIGLLFSFFLIKFSLWKNLGRNSYFYIFGVHFRKKEKKGNDKDDWRTSDSYRNRKKK